MNLQKLASEIAKREGKKSQARIGDVREILKVLCQLEAESEHAGDVVKDRPSFALHVRAQELKKKLDEKAARAKAKAEKEAK